MLLPTSFISFSLLRTSLSRSFQPCPILGSRFPVPSGLATDSVVQSALKDATATLDELVSTSNSSYGTINSNTTSFSIGLFTSNDPLNSAHPFFYEYHYTAPPLSKAKLGTSKLDSESVFRLGTVTQVFTVWVFLIEAGEAHWVDPITKYLPELAEASGQITFGHFSWEDVTLGDLAGHLSGVPRDCKFERLNQVPSNSRHRRLHGSERAELFASRYVGGYESVWLSPANLYESRRVTYYICEDHY
jgi:CubicO group peptidase (beta-lactamase class C family)